MKKFVALSIATVVALSLPAFAGGQHKKDKFEKMDTNADKSISKEEFMAPLAEYKTKMAGKEGAEEKLAKKEEKMAAYFSSLDTDGNGSISAEEMSAKKSTMKMKMKKDKACAHKKKGDADS